MIEDIFKIILPFREKEKEEKAADLSTVGGLLAILPPDEVSAWCDDVHNAYYHRNRIRTQDEYRTFRDRPNTRFFRWKLRRKCSNLDRSFSNLMSFLGTYFFVDHNNTEFFVLYPELRTENPTLYRQRLEELRELVRTFKDDYSDFVSCSSEKYIGWMTLTVSVALILALLVLAIIPLFQSVQTTLVPAGGAAAAEFKLEYPGNYILVDHALSRLDRGAWGVLHVEGEADPAIFDGSIETGHGH